MKIFGAIVAISLALFLFYQAHEIEGITLERLGYIAAAAILVVTTVFIFVPPKNHEEDSKNDGE